MLPDVTDPHPRLRNCSTAILALVFVLFTGGLARAQNVPAMDAVANVDGDPITTADLAKAVGAPLARLEQQLYVLKQQQLAILIDERLMAREAARRNLSLEALVDVEITSKAGTVTEQEIDLVYSSQKRQLGDDEAAAREEIKSQLREQRVAARRQAFLAALRSSNKVSINLQPPPVFTPVISQNGPYRGRADAPVVIVEFQDFQCPFCQGVQPTLAALSAKYGDRVKLVYRDFPIDQLHPLARKAHEAARCANDQGKFWPYHDVLYANAPKASRDDLLSYARETKLDMNVFEQCLDTRLHRADVQRDFEDGVRAGVSGTPTFFINGRAFSGALPMEAFAQVIDEDLARKN